MRCTGGVPSRVTAAVHPQQPRHRLIATCIVYGRPGQNRDMSYRCLHVFLMFAHFGMHCSALMAMEQCACPCLQADEAMLVTTDGPRWYFNPSNKSQHSVQVLGLSHFGLNETPHFSLRQTFFSVSLDGST